MPCDHQRGEPVRIERQRGDHRVPRPVARGIGLDGADERPSGEDNEQQEQRVGPRISGVDQEERARRQQDLGGDGAGTAQTPGDRVEGCDHQSGRQQRERAERDFAGAEQLDPEMDGQVVERSAAIATRSAQGMQHVSQAMGADRPGCCLVTREAGATELPPAGDEHEPGERRDPDPLAARPRAGNRRRPGRRLTLGADGGGRDARGHRACSTAGLVGLARLPGTGCAGGILTPSLRPAREPRPWPHREPEGSTAGATRCREAEQPPRTVAPPRTPPSSLRDARTPPATDTPG
jgi:hypothetical protein